MRMSTNWSFEKNKDGTLCITGYKGEELNVVIPASIGNHRVTAIGAQAFRWRKPNRRNAVREILCNLQSVTIPEGVITIGESAFEGCERLERVVLPDSLETIGACAFSGCCHLTDIYRRHKWVIIKNFDTFNISLFNLVKADTAIVVEANFRHKDIAIRVVCQCCDSEVCNAILCGGSGCMTNDAI